MTFVRSCGEVSCLFQADTTVSELPRRKNMDLDVGQDDLERRSVQVLGLRHPEHKGQQANGQSAFAWRGLPHIAHDGQHLLLQ
jgi:hypothetical protein